MTVSRKVDFSQKSTKGRYEHSGLGDCSQKSTKGRYEHFGTVSRKVDLSVTAEALKALEGEYDHVVAPQAGGQMAALSSPADVVIYGGIAGGGKTYALLLEPLRHINLPGFNAVLFRRTHPQIKRPGGPWDTALELYNRFGARVNASDLTFTFPSGATITMAHMQHDKDKGAWDGAQIAVELWDQLEHFEEKQFLYLFSRNRSTCGIKPYIRATCNPVHADHPVGGWLRRMIDWWISPDDGLPIKSRSGVLRWFVIVDEKFKWGDSKEELLERYPDKDENEPKSLTFIPGKLEENVALLKVDPGYRGWLDALPRVDRERLKYGNWNARNTAGRVFDREWFKVVDTMPACYDWVRMWDRAATDESEANAAHAARTAGALCGMTDDGILVIADMISVQKSAGKVAKLMERVAEQDGKDVTIGIFKDPGGAGKAEAESVVEDLEENGDYIVEVMPTAPQKKQVGDNDILDDSNPKVRYALPWARRAEHGKVLIVRAEWNHAFLSVVENFDGTGRCDEVDAVSGAHAILSNVKLGGSW